MKKEDLKTGMLVQLRNGYVYMVVNDTIVRHCGYNLIESFRDDLTKCSNNKEWDIIKVSKVLNSYELETDRWTQKTLNANLLWEREEEVNELTIEELEKLTGLKNLKIKK